MSREFENYYQIWRRGVAGAPAEGAAEDTTKRSK